MQNDDFHSPNKKTVSHLCMGPFLSPFFFVSMFSISGNVNFQLRAPNDVGRKNGCQPLTKGSATHPTLLQPILGFSDTSTNLCLDFHKGNTGTFVLCSTPKAVVRTSSLSPFRGLTGARPSRGVRTTKCLSVYNVLVEATTHQWSLVSSMSYVT